MPMGLESGKDRGYKFLVCPGVNAFHKCLTESYLLTRKVIDAMPHLLYRHCNEFSVHTSTVTYPPMKRLKRPTVPPCCPIQ
uniref:Uncharacterized protein n=1 Tax=Ditylenchus dipsaci TaxID=166011 RepID=A0A915DXB1_9BILA